MYMFFPSYDVVPARIDKNMIHHWVETVPIVPFTAEVALALFSKDRIHWYCQTEYMQ